MSDLMYSNWGHELQSIIENMCKGTLKIAWFYEGMWYYDDAVVLRGVDAIFCSLSPASFDNH